MLSSPLLLENRILPTFPPPALRPTIDPRGLAVIACMDGRMDPLEVLGVDSAALVLRNAGGRVSDDIVRSLAVAQQTGLVQQVIILHHTGCELSCFSTAELRAQLREDLGADASSLDFLTFSCLERSVLDDVCALRHSPLLHSMPVRGFAHDVHSGRLIEVD